MPAKMRLARHGKKGAAFYHVVVADSRAPRDGRFIERIGSYNPNTNPATIQLNFERALYWLRTGAQPTDTVRRILSYEGVLMKDHLLRGVTKGALTTEQADAKFEAWKLSKIAAIEAKKHRLATETAADRKKRLEAEAVINNTRKEALAKRKAEATAALVAEISGASTDQSTEA
jgi:small subunit ribosomal protein S16